MCSASTQAAAARGCTSTWSLGEKSVHQWNPYLPPTRHHMTNRRCGYFSFSSLNEIYFCSEKGHCSWDANVLHHHDDAPPPHLSHLFHGFCAPKRGGSIAITRPHFFNPSGSHIIAIESYRWILYVSCRGLYQKNISFPYVFRRVPFRILQDPFCPPLGQDVKIIGQFGQDLVIVMRK